MAAPSATCEGRAIGLSGARRSVPSKRSQQGDVIMKSGLAALCAAAVCTAIAFSAAPAVAQSKMKVCADEWNAKKSANETANLKYRDFVKECLTRSAAKPATEEPATPGAAATAPSAAKPAPAPRGAVPPAAGEAVFPTAVSPKYSKETAGRARMHTSLDQYNENKAASGNGGLNWIRKGRRDDAGCRNAVQGLRALPVRCPIGDRG